MGMLSCIKSCLMQAVEYVLLHLTIVANRTHLKRVSETKYLWIPLAFEWSCGWRRPYSCCQIRTETVALATSDSSLVAHVYPIGTALQGVVVGIALAWIRLSRESFLQKFTWCTLLRMVLAFSMPVLPIVRAKPSGHL